MKSYALPKSYDLSEIGRYWIEKHFTLFVCLWRVKVQQYYVINKITKVARVGLSIMVGLHTCSRPEGTSCKRFVWSLSRDGQSLVVIHPNDVTV